MDREELWDRFVNTGNILDYIAYAEYKGFDYDNSRGYRSEGTCIRRTR